MLSDFVISNTKLQSWSNAQNYKKEKKMQQDNMKELCLSGKRMLSSDVAKNSIYCNRSRARICRSKQAIGMNRSCRINK